MNRIKLMMISLLLVPVLATPILAERMRIAIMDFTAQNVSWAEARMISELIRNEMINTKEYLVIERAQMGKILKEQGFQTMGCTDISCAVKAGKLLSARKILVGTVMRLGNKIIITGRIVDVEKGIAEFSEKGSALSKDQLDQAVEIYVDNLTSRMKGKPVSKRRGRGEQRRKTSRGTTVIYKKSSSYSTDRKTKPHKESRRGTKVVYVGARSSGVDSAPFGWTTMGLFVATPFAIIPWAVFKGKTVMLGGGREIYLFGIGMTPNPLLDYLLYKGYKDREDKKKDYKKRERYALYALIGWGGLTISFGIVWIALFVKEGGFLGHHNKLKNNMFAVYPIYHFYPGLVPGEDDDHAFGMGFISRF